MNENIDLTKILEGCPYGTEFYHVVYGKVWFDDISNDYSDDDCYITFSLWVEPLTIVSVTKKGTFSARYDGECLIFPSKDQRDWSKFVRFWDKPKAKKFDPNTLQPFDRVLIKDGSFWTADFFSYIAGQCVNCVGCVGVECVPYNEETKYLIGTTEDCPDYYKWWKK